MQVSTSSSALEQATALSAAMLNLTLFAMVRSTDHPERLTPELLLAHLQWMVSKEDEGAIFASGPFERPDVPRGHAGGLSILRAADIGQAALIADDDPFVKAGAVTYVLHKWILMEGDLHVRMRCSRQLVTFS